MISQRERKRIVEALERAIPHAENGMINVSVEAAKEIIEMLKVQIVEMTICECCGLEHSADDRKCPRCGTVAKTGHWTTKRTELHDGEWYCDQCDYEPTVFEGMPYCPSCGAKMEMGK